MKHGNLLIALLLSFGAFPSITRATESIGCSNEAYSIEFVVSIEAEEIVQFSYFVNGKQQDSAQWVIEKGSLNLEKKTIEFETRGTEGELKNLRLSAKHTKGALHIGDRAVEVVCEWSAFGG